MLHKLKELEKKVDIQVLNLMRTSIITFFIEETSVLTLCCRKEDIDDSIKKGLEKLHAA